MARNKNKSRYRVGSGKTVVQDGALVTTPETSSSLHQQPGSNSKDDEEKEPNGNPRDVKDPDYKLTETQFLQKVFNSYFEGYCTSNGGDSEMCLKCQKSTNPKNADKPCWYGTAESTGKLLKKYILQGCLKEDGCFKHPEGRQGNLHLVNTFSTLSEQNHGLFNMKYTVILFSQLAFFFRRTQKTIPCFITLQKKKNAPS